MENPKIRIESDGKKTEIYYNGNIVEGCVAVTFTHEIDENAKFLITQNPLYKPFKPIDPYGVTTKLL
jgi:hypothetical protein